MAEKIRVKGRLRLPISGVDPSFAQLRFTKVELSEKDILPDSADIFTCDLEGNYDFEIYTGAHLFSHTSGKEWSEPVELIVEPLSDGLSHVRISDLIGFQSIPELDDVTAALNQQKQELLLIQQETESLRDEALSSSDQAAESERLSSENLSTLMSSSLKSKLFGQTEDYSSKVIILHDVDGDAEKHSRFFGRLTAFRSNGFYEHFDCLISSQKTYHEPSQSNFSMNILNGGRDNIYPCYCVFEGKRYFGIHIGTTISSAGEVNASGQWTDDPIEVIYAMNSEVTDPVFMDSITRIDYIEDGEGVAELDYDGVTHYKVTHRKAAMLGIPESVFYKAYQEQEAIKLFESEKQKAQRIFFDFTFGLGEYQIIPMEMDQVKEYIQSIDPSRANVRGAVRNLPRPDIFSRYD